MIIDLGSFAFGSILKDGVGTPSWGTALGQGRPEYYITREGADKLVMGMVYKSVPLPDVSLPLGRGGRMYSCSEAGTIQIASLFNKVFVNGQRIDYPFIMVLQKEASESHPGRRGVKYTDKAEFNANDHQYTNTTFIEMVHNKFGLKKNACWFVYDISVLNYEELHMKAIFVNKENSEEYLNSRDRSEEWTKLIEEAGESYNIEYNTINTEINNSSYRPYITAIKSKPFLLLAGISGTGKSRIVRELARACWDEGSEEYKAQKPKNFEMVQVKPNWHDSSELIGYISRIDGERFVVGPFLKFLVKAINDPEHPYFLCLDEMNLAPVEQYFAEYLSVVESRKVDEDGKVVTDPIIDYEPTEAYKSLIDQLFPYDDSERSKYLTENGGKRLTIPQNLIVIGTVNMDESTFSFSRKVLDRAMTIEMNEVDLEGGLTNRHERIGKLDNEELVGTCVEGADVYNANKEVCDKALAYLKAVNEKLEGTPFKIAYRTRNEFLLYVVNNLPYNKDEDGNDLEQDYVIARALDEITNMKILSRIEGDETKVSEQFLKTLNDTIKEQLEKVFEGPFGTKKTDGTYKSISLAKLDEMTKKLGSGYTSFWS